MVPRARSILGFILVVDVGKNNVGSEHHTSLRQISQPDLTANEKPSLSGSARKSLWSRLHRDNYNNNVNFNFNEIRHHGIQDGNDSNESVLRKPQRNPDLDSPLATEAATTNCSQPRKDTDRYSSSFLGNVSHKAIDVDEEFDVAGEASTRKTSNVHVGEDITLCWIETTTIKEDQNSRPVKRLVIREYTISFENSATIPERYLECVRLEGEVEPGSDVGKTALFEVIDENTRQSRIVNFTTVSHTADLKVWQHKRVRCGMGPVVSKDIIEWTDGSENPKKRVEIKVSPKMHRLAVKDEEECTTDVAADLTTTPLSDSGNCSDGKCSAEEETSSRSESEGCSGELCETEPNYSLSSTSSTTDINEFSVTMLKSGSGGVSTENMEWLPSGASKVVPAENTTTKEMPSTSRGSTPSQTDDLCLQNGNCSTATGTDLIKVPRKSRVKFTDFESETTTGSRESVTSNESQVTKITQDFHTTPEIPSEDSSSSITTENGDRSSITTEDSITETTPKEQPPTDDWKVQSAPTTVVSLEIAPTTQPSMENLETTEARTTTNATKPSSYPKESTTQLPSTELEFSSLSCDGSSENCGNSTCDSSSSESCASGSEDAKECDGSSSSKDCISSAASETPSESCSSESQEGCSQSTGESEEEVTSPGEKMTPRKISVETTISGFEKTPGTYGVTDEMWEKERETEEQDKIITHTTSVTEKDTAGTEFIPGEMLSTTLKIEGGTEKPWTQMTTAKVEVTLTTSEETTGIPDKTTKSEEEVLERRRSTTPAVVPSSMTTEVEEVTGKTSEETVFTTSAVENITEEIPHPTTTEVTEGTSKKTMFTTWNVEKETEEILDESTTKVAELTEETAVEKMSTISALEKEKDLEKVSHKTTMKVEEVTNNTSEKTTFFTPDVKTDTEKGLEVTTASSEVLISEETNTLDIGRETEEVHEVTTLKTKEDTSIIPGETITVTPTTEEDTMTITSETTLSTQRKDDSRYETTLEGWTEKSTISTVAEYTTTSSSPEEVTGKESTTISEPRFTVTDEQNETSTTSKDMSSASCDISSSEDCSSRTEESSSKETGSSESCDSQSGDCSESIPVMTEIEPVQTPRTDSQMTSTPTKSPKDVEDTMTTVGEMLTTDDVRRSTTTKHKDLTIKPSVTSKPKHKLALKIKVLLEHINENKDRQKLAEVERHLLFNEHPNEHGNYCLKNRIEELNKTVDRHIIQALLNCSSIEKLTGDIGKFAEEYMDNNKSSSEFVVPVNRSINVSDGFEDDSVSKFDSLHGSRATPGLLNDSQSLELSRNILSGLDQVISHLPDKNGTNVPDIEMPHSRVLEIISDPKDPRIHSRKKRNTIDSLSVDPKDLPADIEEIGHWSNERVKRDVDGSHFRTLTEFTIYRVP